MRCAKLGGLALLVGMMSVAAAQPTTDNIAARPIKYTDLGKLVRSHRGRVIVVDLWSFD